MRSWRPRREGLLYPPLAPNAAQRGAGATRPDPPRSRDNPSDEQGLWVNRARTAMQHDGMEDVVVNSLRPPDPRRRCRSSRRALRWLRSQRTHRARTPPRLGLLPAPAAGSWQAQPCKSLDAYSWQGPLVLKRALVTQIAVLLRTITAVPGFIMPAIFRYAAALLECGCPVPRRTAVRCCVQVGRARAIRAAEQHPGVPGISCRGREPRQASREYRS